MDDARKRVEVWHESHEHTSLRLLLSRVDWWALLPRASVVDVLHVYSKDWRDALSGDVSAGLVVAIMLIPQALAYAALAGMPPVTGFFAAIIALFTYALTTGTSAHQAVGPVALMSLLSHEAVAGVMEGGGGGAGASPSRFAELSGKLALLVGLIQAGMGVFRAGYLIAFLSHPVLAGFTASSALIIASSQLGKALGLSIPTTAYVWQTWGEVAVRLPQAHAISVAIFVGDLLLFFVLTRARQAALGHSSVKRRPALQLLLRVVSVALVVVTFSILLVWLGGLRAAGVKVLGSVPGGLPPFLPGPIFNASLGKDMARLLPSAILISLITYVESASVAKTMGNKYGVSEGARGVEGSSELVALGLANVAVSVFGGFPVTGGFSRSGVQAEAGARTVVTGAVAGSILCLVVSFATQWFVFLPDVCLAALIMFSAFRLLEGETLRYLWRVDKADAGVYLLTVVTTLGGGIETGLLVGAGLSLLRLVKEAAQPHMAVLGRMPDGVTYRNVARFPGVATPHRGLFILRLDGPLFFANVQVLQDRVVKHAAEEVQSLRAIVLDFSGVSSIDSSGVHALIDAIPTELGKVWRRAHAAAVRRGGVAGGVSSGSAGGPPPPVPGLYVVAARGPVRDRLMEGMRAHEPVVESVHAGVRGWTTRVAGWVARLQPHRQAPLQARPGVGQEGEEAAADPASDGTLQLGSLYKRQRSAASMSAALPAADEGGHGGQACAHAAAAASAAPREAEGAGEGEEEEAESTPLASDPAGITRAVLLHPADAPVLLRQVDLPAAVEAIIALLEQEDAA